MSDEMRISGQGWSAMARDLMQRRRPFYVDGWDDNLDAKEGNSLAKEFDYDLALDPGGSKAVFKPKSSN